MTNQSDGHGMQANAGVKSDVIFYDDFMGAIEFSSKERHMYITTYTTQFNLAETWPGVYWGMLGATTLERLNFDFCFLPDQSRMLSYMLEAADIDFSDHVSSVVQACATSKACPSVQLVGVTTADTLGHIEES